MTYPDPANRFCCAACREPIVDPPMVTPLEAESLRLAYEATRRKYRTANPHLTRQQIEDAAA